MNSKISVVIPARNEEEYIGKTLDGILQNKLNVEIIVVCDNCMDSTREIAEKYTKNVFDVNFDNVAKSRNYGAKEAKGEILVFLDADTLVSENYFTEIQRYMKSYDYGVARWKSESKHPIGVYFAKSVNIANRVKHVINGNSFMLRSAFLKVGEFNEELSKAEDTELGERMNDAGMKFIYAKNIYQIPSERVFRKMGYFKRLLESQIDHMKYHSRKLT